MDLHCPAVVICVAPLDDIPAEAGGQRVVAAYLAQGVPTPNLALPTKPAPAGNVWQIMEAVSDEHRGEAVALVVDPDLLDKLDIRGVSFSVDSLGPQRIT